jgi:hypothetical protein
MTVSSTPCSDPISQIRNHWIQTNLSRAIKLISRSDGLSPLLGIPFHKPLHLVSFIDEARRLHQSHYSSSPLHNTSFGIAARLASNIELLCIPCSTSLVLLAPLLLHTGCNLSPTGFCHYYCVLSQCDHCIIHLFVSTSKSISHCRYYLSKMELATNWDFPIHLLLLLSSF